MNKRKEHPTKVKKMTKRKDARSDLKENLPFFQSEYTREKFKRWGIVFAREDSKKALISLVKKNANFVQAILSQKSKEKHEVEVKIDMKRMQTKIRKLWNDYYDILNSERVIQLPLIPVAGDFVMVTVTSNG